MVSGKRQRLLNVDYQKVFGIYLSLDYDPK